MNPPRETKMVRGISNVVAAALLIVVAIAVVAVLGMGVLNKANVGSTVTAQAMLVSARMAGADKMTYVIQMQVDNNGNTPVTIKKITALMVGSGTSTTTSGQQVVTIWSGSGTTTSGTTTAINPSVSPNPANTPINPGSSQTFVITFTGPKASQLILQLTIDVNGVEKAIVTNPINVG